MSQFPDPKERTAARDKPGHDQNRRRFNFLGCCCSGSLSAARVQDPRDPHIDGVPRHDIHETDAGVDREGLGRVPGADRVTLESGARDRQLRRGARNHRRRQQQAQKGVFGRWQHIPVTAAGEAAFRPDLSGCGQPRRSSAFLFKDAMSPSMPFVRRIVANSERFVANSLIVPVT